MASNRNRRIRICKSARLLRVTELKKAVSAKGHKNGSPLSKGTAVFMLLKLTQASERSEAFFIFCRAVDSISLIRFSWFTSEAPGS